MTEKDDLTTWDTSVLQTYREGLLHDRQIAALAATVAMDEATRRRHELAIDAYDVRLARIEAVLQARGLPKTHE